MTLTEHERHDAYDALRRTFGDATDNVISMLQPAHELVTKDDLALTTADLRTEMADLRTEMADLRTELRTDMADLRTELKTEMADLRSEFRTVISAEIGAQTRTMVVSLVGSVILLAIANMLTVALT